LKPVEDGDPVHAGALHSHVPNVLRPEPSGQLPEVVGRGAERSQLLSARRECACHHRLLVDVQATATLVHNLHLTYLPKRIRGWLGGRRGKNFPSVLTPAPCTGGQQSAMPSTRRLSFRPRSQPQKKAELTANTSATHFHPLLWRAAPCAFPGEVAS